MSKPVTVTIPHDLGKAEARRRIEQGLGDIRSDFQQSALNLSFEDRWHQDRLEFNGGKFGQQIRGHLDVGEEAVQVEIELPRLMAALAGNLKQRIARRGQALLQHRPF